MGDFDVILGGVFATHQGNGGHRHALVDDRDAKLLFNLAAYGYQTLCTARNLVIDSVADDGDVISCAVVEGDTHGDGTNVKVLLLDHIDGFQYVFDVDHDRSLDLVHGVENIFVHGTDEKVVVLTEFGHAVDEICKRYGY